MPATVQGRFIGVLILIIIQIHNGLIHAVSGLVFLFSPHLFPLSLPSSLIGVVFYIYTLLYGLLSLIFAYARALRSSRLSLSSRRPGEGAFQRKRPSADWVSIVRR